MKIKLFASAFVISTVTIAITFIGSSSASAGTTTFVCGTSKGVPTTMAKTPRGNVPVIRWNSDYFNNSGWTPQKRCQEVSKKFQTFYQNGTLKYLTTADFNGQSAVCVAERENGSCNPNGSGILFTLKPGSNPGETLQQLLSVRVHAAGPLNESSPRVYINMNQFLETAPVEGTTSGNSSVQPLF